MKSVFKAIYTEAWTADNAEFCLSAEREQPHPQTPCSQGRHGNLGKDLSGRRQEIALLSEIWGLAAKCLITSW